MKKLLSLMLVMVIAVTVIIALVPSVEASAAHSVVMTADEFIGYLQYVVDRGDSKYGSGGEKSIGKYDGKYIYFDCWGLGESIICTKGQIVYNKNTSVNPWNLWDTSCGCGSKTGDWLKSQSELSTDFTNILPGEWLFKDNANGSCYHVGYYIGDGKVIESTTDGSYNTQITTIDSSGRSNIRGSSWKWTSHGKVPWISYHTCSGFTGLGICTECGKSYDWQNTFSTADAGTYKVIKDFTPRTNAPYSDATKGDEQIKKGSTVKVDGSYINAYNNKWIKFTYNGEVGYVLGDGYLELSSLNNLNVTCTGFTPTENESLPLGQGYPVWGTVSSNYPLKKVVAKLDGNEYATWTATNDNTTSFAINPTDINQKLKFGSLSAGKHTITLIATDVHGRTQTFLTRNFNMVSTSCSHSYSSTYSKDANNHWKVCSKCGSTASVEAHVYSNSCDTSCNTCGATRSVSHTYEYTWDEVPGGDFNPAPQHYQECTKCGDKKDYENHTWELMLASNGQYMTLQTLHIYECTICGKGKYEDHIYDSACDMDCSVCGRDDRPNVTHSFGTSYSKNESGHWHNCSVCGERDSTESHVYSNNRDITCNTCGYSRAATHTYTNACDTSCNICGATRTTSHEYDNACDSSCNACGATRTANHKYSNACDKSCDVCGATRSVPDHVYDNDCDTSCNSCGYSRSTTHRYNNACDSTCNTCGATRSVAHTYTSQYSSNSTSHWRMCTSCGHNGYIENHIPGASATETAPQKCLVCQFVLQEAIGHTHSFENKFEHDDYQHWNKCSDESCGAKTNVEKHNFDNGTVNKEPTTTEKGEITYTCNVCGMKKIEDIDILPDGSNPDDDQESGEDNSGGSQTPGDDSQGGSQDSGKEDVSNGGIDTTTVIIIAASTAVIAAAGTAIVFKRKPATPKNKAKSEIKEERTEDNE